MRTVSGEKATVRIFRVICEWAEDRFIDENRNLWQRVAILAGSLIFQNLSNIINFLTFCWENDVFRTKMAKMSVHHGGNSPKLIANVYIRFQKLL